MQNGCLGRDDEKAAVYHEYYVEKESKLAAKFCEKSLILKTVATTVPLIGFVWLIIDFHFAGKAGKIHCDNYIICYTNFN